jgi:putative alpha-1,2-mannosidase
MPFGMVKFSPDNQEEGWGGGYEYTGESIAGFSHIHSWTMGGLLFMPATGPLQTKPGPEDDPDSGYRSRFSHQRETASPGYYAVTLDDYGVRAELTTTTRAGFQRYTFPEAEKARILIDLNIPTEYGFKVNDAVVRRVSDTEIEGYARQEMPSSNAAGALDNKYTVHFVAKFDTPFEALGGWNGADVDQDVDSVARRGDVGAFVQFSAEAEKTIQVKTGISLVSVEQARLNLETEIDPFGWDFEAVRQHARDTWNDLLERVEVEGSTAANKKKFLHEHVPLVHRAHHLERRQRQVRGHV